MALKVFSLVSLLISALVMGVFWGPWVALSRSMQTFEPVVFLAVVKRMSVNVGSVMTVLMPLALVSLLPVLWLSFSPRRTMFYTTLASFAMFFAALLVTVLVEVPLVKEMETWTVATMPDGWQGIRDRWGRFHLVRVAASIAGFALLAGGAIG